MLCCCSCYWKSQEQRTEGACSPGFLGAGMSWAQSPGEMLDGHAGIFGPWERRGAYWEGT